MPEVIRMFERYQYPLRSPVRKRRKEDIGDYHFLLTASRTDLITGETRTQIYITLCQSHSDGRVRQMFIVSVEGIHNGTYYILFCESNVYACNFVTL